MPLAAPGELDSRVPPSAKAGQAPCARLQCGLCRSLRPFWGSGTRGRTQLASPPSTLGAHHGARLGSCGESGHPHWASSGPRPIAFGWADLAPFALTVSPLRGSTRSPACSLRIAGDPDTARPPTGSPELANEKAQLCSGSFQEHEVQGKTQRRRLERHNLALQQSPDGTLIQREALPEGQSLRGPGVDEWRPNANDQPSGQGAHQAEVFRRQGNLRRGVQGRGCATPMTMSTGGGYRGHQSSACSSGDFLVSSKFVSREISFKNPTNPVNCQAGVLGFTVWCDSSPKPHLLLTASP